MDRLVKMQVTEPSVDSMDIANVIFQQNHGQPSASKPFECNIHRFIQHSNGGAAELVILITTSCCQCPGFRQSQPQDITKARNQTQTAFPTNSLFTQKSTRATPPSPTIDRKIEDK